MDLILSDVGTEPGALPLLSHALLETWKRRQGHTLTLQGYHEAGGVKKAIAQTAENVFDQLTPAEQTIARGIFLRLIELGEGLQGIRRRAKISELLHIVETQDLVAKVLKILTDARLVTTEQDSAEVSHEALIREWGTLRRWLDEDRESLRLYYHLTESAHEWERRGREASDLYRGTRLKQVIEWSETHADLISSLEKEYIQGCLANQRHERYVVRIRWLGILGAIVFSLIAGWLALTGRLNQFIYNPLPMDWVTVPAGEFRMGSEYGKPEESPVHAVYLDNYEIGKYEVTNKQYYQCIKAGVCSLPRNPRYNSPEYVDHPVTDVSWIDANTFCGWNDPNGRLPTEAEWEKAARGTDGRTYPWGEGIDCSYANYFHVNIYCIGTTTPVGSYESGKSPYGAYDMAGNVWEWVADWYSGTYFASSPESNPLGPENGEFRVMRGGSLLNGGVYLRSAARTRSAAWISPTGTDSYVGFRCARDVP